MWPLDSDTLRFVVDQHREEINRHQDAVGKIFNWSVTIILALAAGFFTLRGSEGWSKMAYQSQLLVCVVIAVVCGLIALLASREMYKRVHASDENARVIVKASRMLSLFEIVNDASNEALYPKKWLSWGDRTRPSTKISPWFNILALFVIAVGVSMIVLMALF